MTKKIKFLEDYTKRYFADIVVTQNKQYDIICEKVAHYNFVDDVGNPSAVLKKNSKYKYEIIEEPKVKKYIKIITFADTSPSWYKNLTLNKYYEVTSEDNYRYYFSDDIGDSLRVEKDLTIYRICVGHPWKHLIKNAAELAESTMDIGSHFQYYEPLMEKWRDCTPNAVPNFNPEYEYRIKPKTIKIGDVEINAPARKKLEEGEIYYYPVLSNEKLFAWREWDNYDHDEYFLKNGLVFLTKEEAIAASKAIIELLKVG